MSVRILSASDVEEAIKDISEEMLLVHTGRLFYRLSHPERENGSQCPARSSIMSEDCTVLTMPGYVPEVGMSVKVVGVPRPSGTPSSRSTRTSATATGVSATTIVVDENTGGAKGVVNARELTALRTAAGSLLATKLVIKEGRPTSLVLFGAGLQIQYHARLLLNAFPSIVDCCIINRSINLRASTLCQRLTQWYPTKKIELLPESSKERIAKRTLEADIVCFATSATTPLIPSSSSNSGSWVKSGAHIILVGSYTPHMREVPTDIIRRVSRVVVDSREEAMREAGELLEAQLNPETDLIQLGELLKEDGRSSVEDCVREAQRGDITCFKSVGLAAQDVMIAHLVLSAAEKRYIGTVINNWE